MLDLVRREHVSLLVRFERPHLQAVPVPESLLRLKSFYCLRNKYIIHREKEIQIMIKEKMAVKMSGQKTQMTETM